MQGVALFILPPGDMYLPQAKSQAKAQIGFPSILSSKVVIIARSQGQNYTFLPNVQGAAGYRLKEHQVNQSVNDAQIKRIASLNGIKSVEISQSSILYPLSTSLETFKHELETKSVDVVFLYSIDTDFFIGDEKQEKASTIDLLNPPGSNMRVRSRGYLSVYDSEFNVLASKHTRDVWLYIYPNKKSFPSSGYTFSFRSVTEGRTFAEDIVFNNLIAEFETFWLKAWD